jgi:hypothetical protein
MSLLLELRLRLLGFPIKVVMAWPGHGFAHVGSVRKAGDKVRHRAADRRGARPAPGLALRLT